MGILLRMELPGKKKQVRRKRRSIDAVKEDMKVVEVTEEDTYDRTNRRRKILCGDPLTGTAERRRSSTCYLSFLPFYC